MILKSSWRKHVSVIFVCISFSSIKTWYEKLKHIFLVLYNQGSHHTWSSHWSWCVHFVHVSQACVTWHHFHGLLTVKFTSSFQDYVSFSITNMPYNQGSLVYVVHTLPMKGTCYPGMVHLTLTSFSWSDFVLKINIKFSWLG